MPLASALVAHRERYFEQLDAYRRGEILPIIATFTEASRIASAESRVTAARLAEIPHHWRDLTGPVREGSAASKLLARLSATPIFSSDEACDSIDSPRSSVFAAITRLSEAGVLRPLTARSRNQVWGAVLVLAELDDLGVRIAAAAR